MRLVSTETQDLGNLRRVRSTYEEQPGRLTDAYVNALLIVGDRYRAAKLLTAGETNGWRFWTLDGGYVEAWAPDGGIRPVTWTFRNYTLWRVIKARREGN